MTREKNAGRPITDAAKIRAARAIIHGVPSNVKVFVHASVADSSGRVSVENGEEELVERIIDAMDETQHVRHCLWIAEGFAMSCDAQRAILKLYPEASNFLEVGKNQGWPVRPSGSSQVRR